MENQKQKFMPDSLSDRSMASVADQDGARELLESDHKYQQALATFPTEQRSAKERAVTEVFRTLSERLARHDWSARQDGCMFGVHQQAILRLKLARYFQRHDACDTSTLFDALIESPRFLETEKGSLRHLLDVHQQKTLQKITELRKRRTEIRDTTAYNPHENLFVTSSGNYYLARLLNMPHLEQDSIDMKNCVGLSDAYIKKMKYGEIEIFSLRHMPEIDPTTGRLTGDTPVVTIEYNCKTCTIEQLKKYNNKPLIRDDPFFGDVINALQQIRQTHTDTNKIRDITHIADSAVQNIKVSDYHFLTEHGEIALRDFDPRVGMFTLKMGRMNITPDIPSEQAVEILWKAAGIECQPSSLARAPDEINQYTKVYVGKLTPGIFQQLSRTEHIYREFPKRKIKKEELELPGLTGTEWAAEFEKLYVDIDNYVGYMLSPNFAHRAVQRGMTDALFKRKDIPSPEKEVATLIRCTVADLGFPNGATISEIYSKAEKLGLECCQAEAAFALCKKYVRQSIGGHLYVGIKHITNCFGNSLVLCLTQSAGLRLSSRMVRLDDERDPGDEFVFHLRPLISKVTDGCSK